MGYVELCPFVNGIIAESTVYLQAGVCVSHGHILLLFCEPLTYSFFLNLIISLIWLQLAQ